MPFTISASDDRSASFTLLASQSNIPTRVIIRYSTAIADVLEEDKVCDIGGIEDVDFTGVIGGCLVGSIAWML
jgi:hypothetical protein